MSANLARTADGWWVVTPAGLVRLALPATTTAELLADRAAVGQAVEAAQARAAATPREVVPAESLDLLSPVTAPARVVAQAVNYRSHATDSGFDPDTVPPAFFRKASHSITGPAGDIIRPDGVGFLDYEVELGLVIGADLPVGTTVTDASLARYVAALVVTNDVSARQIQLTKTQFYEAKSYPTFTPAGPWLTLVDAQKLAGLLPPATRWRLFFGREARNPRYLHDGDVITAAIASPDGRLDLGTQHNTVIGKTS
jgi:2-keto-4-pentenoate hydratase/2-oxohepta-3-ene-1,7-dioic acid hydratase in catechol pathway